MTAKSKKKIVLELAIEEGGGCWRKGKERKEEARRCLTFRGRATSSAEASASATSFQVSVSSENWEVINRA